MVTFTSVQVALLLCTVWLFVIIAKYCIDHSMILDVRQIWHDALRLPVQEEASSPAQKILFTAASSKLLF